MNIVIFHCNDITPEAGGICRISKVLGDILMENNHQVWYMSLNKSDGMTLPNQLCLNLGSGNIELCQTLFNTIIKEKQIELFIYQDCIIPQNNIILRWARRNNLKVIGEIHNIFEGMYGINGHPIFRKVESERCKKILNRLIFSYFRLKYAKLYREQFVLCNRIVVISPKFLKGIKMFTKWEDYDKFVFIPNPVTLNPAKTIQARKKEIVSVGIIFKTKRLDLLLEIWSVVSKVDHEWILRIIGDGELLDQIRKQSIKMGLSNIYFEGRQSPAPYYSNASILCHTAGYESWGLVLTEAMAFGVVPMAFNSFETACDIIDNGINGYLIEPFNVSDYAQKLLFLMNHETALKKMSENAMAKSKTFSLEKFSNHWLDVIGRL